MRTDLINIIFGMKVRQARTDKGLSLTEFASQAGMSASYMTEIEKGRKYPKTDKIMRMAQVLGKQYDDLVSIRLDPSLKYLETAFNSPLLQAFPFEEFGFELGDFIDLLTRSPGKVSALLHALTAISRRFDVRDEHFLRAALRSYQELHENYFADLEDAAAAFVAQRNIGLPVSYQQVHELVTSEFGYRLDSDMLDGNDALGTYRSVFVPGRKPRLLINSALTETQIKFLLLREIGYKVLKLKNRAFTSPPEVVESFDQVFNDFRASYFAGAVMMPKAQMLADIEAFFAQDEWHAQPLYAMLKKYQVTPEMLLYRFSELVPQFFGIGLHFLRVNNVGDDYRLVKQLNMSGLPLPSGIGLNEHYCRRWLTVRLLMEMREQDAPITLATPHVGVQMSEFLDNRERFLCIGFGRPLALAHGSATSVIVGFQVDGDLDHTIRFADDASIPTRVINETCERCPLTESECSVRAAPPKLYRRQQAQRTREQALQRLLAELRN